MEKLFILMLFICALVLPACRRDKQRAAETEAEAPTLPIATVNGHTLQRRV